MEGSDSSAGARLSRGDVGSKPLRHRSFRLLVESPEPDGNGDIVPQEESISFMRPDFKKLGNAKQKILKRLAELKLPGGDSGWAQLCRDALQFKEIGNGADE